MSQSAQVVAERWRTNLSRSGEKIKAGIEAVSESPMDKAAAASEKYVQGVQDAVASGRYQAGLRSVSLAEWKDAAINKGIARISSGATAALPKVQQFMSEFLPFVENVSNTVRAMPSSTFEDRINRMVRNAELIHEFRRSR